jgi:peptidyl-prolyl cis-trans isomerase C
MPIKTRTLLAAAAASLALGACGPQKDAAPAAKAVAGDTVATVNGTPISAARVDAIARQGAGAGRPDSPEARQAIIDGLALQMLVADEAVKKGLDKTPEVVDQIDGMRQSILANAYVQDYIKTHPVGDDALKAEYERIKATVTGSEYKARHILVDKEAEARDIIARLKRDPASFARLAAEKSKDPGSKTRGGDLGWFDARQMVPEFSAAVASLDKGSFTQEPVKTQFGYHVILLEDTKPIEAPPFDDVKANLSQQMQQQNVRKMLDELKTAAKIEIVDAAAPAAGAASKAE